MTILKERVDVMFDLETLGTSLDSTIIQIAAAAFDIGTGEISSIFEMSANISYNQELSVDGNTLKWWLNENPALLQDILSGNGTGEGSSSEGIVREFHKWLTDFNNRYRRVYLWGNGPLFDNAMIYYQFEKQRLQKPIHFRNDRDLRTLVDVASAKLGMTDYDLKAKLNRDDLVSHLAVDDVLYQIHVAHKCYNILMKGEGL